MTVETVLSIEGLDLPPYSARGLKQTITPISSAAVLRRDLNGALQDLGASQFRKLATTITGADVAPPALDGVWPGAVLVIDCLQEWAVRGVFAEDTEATELPLGRDYVPGSIRNDGTFTYYRPRLTMRLVEFSMDADEWAAGVAWNMTCEEI